jgi:hypothetical protein
MPVSKRAPVEKRELKHEGSQLLFENVHFVEELFEVGSAISRTFS